MTKTNPSLSSVDVSRLQAASSERIRLKHHPRRGERWVEDALQRFSLMGVEFSHQGELWTVTDAGYSGRFTARSYRGDLRRFPRHLAPGTTATTRLTAP